MFETCYALKEINVDSENNVFKSIDGVLYSNDGKTLLRYPINKTADTFTIPNGVTKIDRYAFSDCEKLKLVIFPDSLTIIDIFAFLRCSSLDHVSLSNNLQKVNFNAFLNCTSLTIYCEAESQPSGWDSYWNNSNCPVVWGHTHEYENGSCVCGKAE